VIVEGSSWTSFRWTRWGPVQLVLGLHAVEARVGDAVVQVDLTDTRPAGERGNAFESAYDRGAPLSVNGSPVGTIARDKDGPAGIIRRSRHLLVAGAPLDQPGLRLTDRGLPDLLTLRDDQGVLVASRRWASPVNMAINEWSFVREHDAVPPRVSKRALPEHVALWFAVRETL